MVVFDGLKFKLEEVLGTVDSADVRERIAELQQELRQWSGSKTGDETDEIRAKIAELRDKYADAFSHLPSPATVYSGGPILTMTGSSPEYVEALVVRDGLIACAGTASEAAEVAGLDSTHVDLSGKALLPGFIDAHGHLLVAAHQIEQAWLRDEKVTNIPEMIEALKQQAVINDVQPGDWIIGAGWHPAVLAELRPPTADELDQVSTEFPVMAIHASGHQASVNHKALELAGYGAGVADPEGGVIGRVEGTDVPNGYLEEAPVFYMRTLMPPLASTKYVSLMDRAMTQWASNGFTTAQEDLLGGGASDDWDIIGAAIAEGPLKIDVLGFVEPKNVGLAREKYGDRVSEYVDGFRLGGIKIFLDGSLGGATAWVSEPYVGMENSPNPVGVPTKSDEELEAELDEFYPSDLQIQAHQNGDAALDQFIAGLTKAIAKHGKLDKRPVGIHCQVVRPEQWAQIKELGIVPSLYPSTFRVQADIASGLIGERMVQFNAAGTALAQGVLWTAHNDAPLLPPSAMALLDGAVNRTSAAGNTYSPEVGVSTFEALKAITVSAAYQNFEEASKGTLEVGKLADLVILDRDPLTVDPGELMSVKVVETIKAGTTVYCADV